MSGGACISQASSGIIVEHWIEVVLLCELFREQYVLKENLFFAVGHGAEAENQQIRFPWPKLISVFSGCHLLIDLRASMSLGMSLSSTLELVYCGSPSAIYKEISPLCASAGR